VIRIGGQSKSKILEGKNLRIVSQGREKTKSEGYLLATIYQKLEDQSSKITKALGRLHVAQQRPTWSNLKYHIQKNHRHLFAQFSRFDDEGFEAVGRDPFDVWIQTAKDDILDEKLPLDEKRNLLGAARQNVNDLSPLDRSRLVGHWIKELREELTDDLYEMVKNANSLQKDLDNIHDEFDRRVLETSDVIGITTTGLARRISVLQRVQCKVLICEEAGEVLESHIISAMLPNMEHMIQIGDHQQLRPQINNHGLSLESNRGAPYKLDRSQFERLSVGEPGRPPFPVAQLNVQRRMRPEISELIRATLYPRLIDHESTKILPNVVGMRKNIFWLDHENSEEGASQDQHQKSHSNLWEVGMTHALVRHIIRQGVYSSSDIAVLTPYTGQLQELRRKLSGDFELVLSELDQETLARDGFSEKIPAAKEDPKSSIPGRKSLAKKKLSEMLRIGTVDNFQGCEAQIIIVSLVRSNQQQKVGFLKTTNRINVLLSRAQHGMYLIGNAHTYSNIPMWAQVLGILRASDSVGKGFGLCCPRHSDTEIQVSEPIDFENLSPEGGCRLSCDRRLPDCGHRCQAACHSEAMHLIFQCPQPCQRLHSPCNHGCQKETCGEDCGLCMVKFDNVVLPCGHSKDGVPCYQTQILDKVHCKVGVMKDVPGCNHSIEVECSKVITEESFKCPSACKVDLVCGHRCPGTCSKCYRMRPNGLELAKHSPCSKVCGRRFGTCNHTCPKPCHDGTDCGPCSSNCKVRCPLVSEAPLPIWIAFILMTSPIEWPQRTC
jgi:hypothetical protein